LKKDERFNKTIIFLASKSRRFC